MTVGVSWRRRVRTRGRVFKQFLLSMSECRCDACTLLHPLPCAYNDFFRDQFLEMEFLVQTDGKL